MRKETWEIPAYKASHSQKPTFWYSPSESRQQWPEWRYLKKILAGSWRMLKAYKDTIVVVCPCLIQISSWGERLPFGGQNVQSYKMRAVSLWLYCYHLLYRLIAGKDRTYCFFRKEVIISPSCADLVDSVILITYLILSRGHSVPLAHPSAETASGWSDCRLCLAHFGPKASGHFQFPPGDLHLQI